MSSPSVCKLNQGRQAAVGILIESGKCQTSALIVRAGETTATGAAKAREGRDVVSCWKKKQLISEQKGKTQADLNGDKEEEDEPRTQHREFLILIQPV